MALSLLSIGLITIHGALRQTIQVRGQARDCTQVRFLLESIIAHVELQPILVEGSDSGTFEEGDLSRFAWSWKVSKVEVPLPPFPPDIPPEVAANFQLPAPYLTKIEAKVSWTRSGKKFEERAETLANPAKLFIPKETTP